MLKPLNVIRIFCIVCGGILCFQIFNIVTKENYIKTRAIIADVYSIQDFGRGDDSAKNLHYIQCVYEVNGIEYESKQQIFFKAFAKKGKITTIFYNEKSPTETLDLYNLRIFFNLVIFDLVFLIISFVTKKE